MSGVQTLIARAALGDEGAIDELVSEHRPTIVRTSLGLLADPAAAEDVAQEVILRMQASLAGFRGDAELSTWLYRVTLNACRDQLRRVRRQGEHVEISEAPNATELRLEPMSDERVDIDRARQAVREAIERLPADQREVVLLRFVEDLPYAEIARVTGTPQGTVASRVFRAIERLGSEVEPIHLEVLE